MNQTQIFKQSRFGHLDLEFVIYLGFGICDLGFERVKRC